MKKAASAWPIAAASLALAGYILFAGAMPAIGRDFSMLSTVDYEPNAHETAEPFRDVAVGVSTEKANLADFSCRSAISAGSAGSIALDRVIAENAVSSERSAGNVQFSGCDAAELHIKTSAGDVTGSLPADKVFEAGAGRLDVPNTTAGGRDEIATSAGISKWK